MTVVKTFQRWIVCPAIGTIGTFLLLGPILIVTIAGIFVLKVFFKIVVVVVVTTAVVGRFLAVMGRFSFTWDPSWPLLLSAALLKMILRGRTSRLVGSLMLLQDLVRARC